VKVKIVFSLLFIVPLIFAQAKNVPQNFDRVAFYAAMASGKLEEINAQLDIINKSSFAEKIAFEGTLLMNKAGLISGAGNKLSTFKAGHKKLEAEIQKDSSNAEFRFLRLMIQEHAPGFLGYKSELQNDKEYIRKNFKKLLPAVQHAVTDYSQKSKILKPADLTL
jgi:hypothetical protein